MHGIKRRTMMMIVPSGSATHETFSFITKSQTNAIRP
jgi:hypothetical protein